MKCPIEYLPAARKAVEQDLKFNVGREVHFCGLNHVARTLLGRVTLTANERAAAQLLEALSAYEICDADLRETAMDKIINAGAQFEEVTGRAIQLKPAKVGVGGTASAGSSEPPPVTAEVVKNAFPMIEWGDKLSKVSETKYKWLSDAVRHKGSPRPGDAKLFSLAAVAAALVLRGNIRLSVADEVLKAHPDWAGAWGEAREYLTEN